MTSLAVMQPTYMPWVGYFDLIDQADHFIFLDDVQLARQSWQTRNRIRGPGGGELMLSLPIRHQGEIATTLHETQLDDSKPWRHKQARTIAQAYARAPFGKAASALWTECLDASQTSLSDFTINAIKLVCQALGISTPTQCASELELKGDRVNRLIAFCQSTGANTYLSPPGAADYLATDRAERRFDDAGVQLRFQRYEHPAYNQGQAPFLSHLGIVDVLAHAGPEAALTIIRSGRRAPITSTQLAEV